MRRKDREITDRKELEKIINGSQICRLAMVDGDVPYIIPLNFGYRDGTLFFHSAPEGRKIDLIRVNPNVCFEMDELVRFKKAKLACDWGIEYKSVIGTGKAELVNNLEEKTDALNVIMAQYSGRPFGYPDDMLKKTTVIKVSVAQMTGKKS